MVVVVVCVCREGGFAMTVGCSIITIHYMTKSMFCALSLALEILI